MKRIVLAAIIAALPSATVYGQTQGDKPNRILLSRHVISFFRDVSETPQAKAPGG